MNKQLRLIVENLLKQSISDDYIGTLINEIIIDIEDDIKTSADADFNEDDVKLAIGRVLLNKLGVEV